MGFIIIFAIVIIIYKIAVFIAVAGINVLIGLHIIVVF
jgi:hypothetical protein